MWVCIHSCSTLTRSSSWGNAQFLPKIVLQSRSKSTHFKCVLNIHRELCFFLKSFWKLPKWGTTFLIHMKRVLKGTHWTAYANFLHPVLKCVHCVKPSFYKSIIHLETSVIWLQVINSILASTWGGWRGSVSMVIGIGETTLIWSPTWNHFFHVLEN